MDFDSLIPEEAREIGARIEATGGEAFLVGGWVRDVMRDVTPRDVDIATDLPPDRVAAAVRGLGSVYDFGADHGTIGVAFRDGGPIIEITTYRSDVYDTDTPAHRAKEIAFVDNIEDDLVRRDFTVNAMAVSLAPEPGRLVDPYRGAKDIERRVIRTPRSPAKTVREDPLRMMRAVRFAAELGYDIYGPLREEIAKKADTLEGISRERRRDELERLLVSPNPDGGIRDLLSLGLMVHVVPEFLEVPGIEQPRKLERSDLLEHTLHALAYVRPDPLLRRAVFFHDIGKPSTMATEPKLSFHQHDSVGAQLTRKAMSRLRYSHEDIDNTSFLVFRHMYPFAYRPDWNERAVRRFIRACTHMRNGEVAVLLEYVLEMARADIEGGNAADAPKVRARLNELVERVDAVREQDSIIRAVSPLDGNELMEAFGRGPGPWLREVKEHLVELVVDGDLGQDDREAALQRAREFIEDS
ncbi:MAG: CCA tRNA nucleotidyltransferase [Actinobacteria bacterium]|nr:CCA tRNA nucleotidyltransferase [Actinomycetota bacterium]MBU1945167.1 CCA tRNA nucleotidyltransferase [Actinomycetota bacterium]MBU2687705.1 CCA tRNA nucleotidyltransferase [Actinomycetota bacterium]